MNFIAEEISPDTFVNLMGQYQPAGKVNREKYPEIDRRITIAEMKAAHQSAQGAGIWRFDERR